MEYIELGPLAIDRRGQVGDWTVLGPIGRSANGKAVMWHCRCVCGVERSVSSSNLANGRSRGCGCRGGERNSPEFHGKTGDALYRTWCNIRNRCNNPKDDRYADYGGRGIAVCDRWDKSFSAFCEDVGLRPSIDYTLDRIDNYGDYEPGNVRWATRGEQLRNMRANVYIEYNGERMIVADFAKLLGVKYYFVSNRILRGMSIEDIAKEAKLSHEVLI